MPSNGAARDNQRRSRRWVRVGCWTIVAAAACGKSAPSGEGHKEGCDALAEAATAYIQKCVPSKSVPLAIAQRFALECKMVAGAPGVTGLGVTLAACQAAYESATETCARIDATPCSPPTGALPAGAPCGADAQCASGLCSVVAAGIDAPSAYFSFTAAHNDTTPAAAVTRGAGGTCAPTTVPGQPCDGTCTGGQVCQGSVCVASPSPGDVGQFCLDDYGCKDGLQCDALELTCAIPPGEGQPCFDPHASMQWGCVAPFVCQQASPVGMGTCVPGSPEGGQCSTSGGLACARGLQCYLAAGAAPNDPSGGTCSSHDRIPAAGQPCEGAQVCELGVCASGSCPVPISDGQACDAYDQTAIRAPCNYFSECITGTCVLFDPRSCN
jgi:hypothetical protein